MRKGFTTGSYLTATALGSLIYKKFNRKPRAVNIILPKGEIANIPIYFDGEICFSIKDAGDDPDITNRIRIECNSKLKKGSGKINIIVKRGIGIVTKKGLQVEVGQPAINPTPKKMLIKNLKHYLSYNEDLDIEISVPEGEKIAKKTFNPRLGIVGGISILGSSGIVEPMSLTALINSIYCEIDVVLNESNYFFIVAGKIGERFVKKYYNYPTIMVSNYFKEAFDYLKRKGVRKFSLAGHPGKLAKIAMGYYNTHSKQSPSPIPFIKKLLNLKGEFNTTEEIALSENLDKVAVAIKNRVFDDYGFDLDVILFDMKGNIVGKS
ncbi:cobalt-precorrin-5B (C(1))-methyltransferase CbiD [Hippea jasoniae]|uniref:cobalt-precorrin-5B (C(1))-methyltransferase CbiD n=1 Tax=Hippea jasoniae TaxID=944479 RepID=UPI000555E33B|nr:cobalt-precorrin-5B (C(1))-methyltransferase CbiD [Hippea jasoniae]